MKIEAVDLDSASLVTLVLIMAAIFASYYVTSMGKGFIHFFTDSAASALQIPQGIALALIFAVFTGLVSFVFLIAGTERVKVVGAVCFMIFLPSALEFSNANWLPAHIQASGTEWSVSFFLTVAAAIAVFSLLIVLNFIVSTKQTHRELLKRGANQQELPQVSAGSIYYSLRTVGVAAVLSLAAVAVVVAAQPAGLALMKTAPFAVLLFGIATVVALAVLVAYYFRQNREVTPKT